MSPTSSPRSSARNATALRPMRRGRLPSKLRLRTLRGAVEPSLHAVLPRPRAATAPLFQPPVWTLAWGLETSSSCHPAGQAQPLRDRPVHNPSVAKRISELTGNASMVADAETDYAIRVVAEHGRGVVLPHRRMASCQATRVAATCSGASSAAPSATAAASA